MLKTIYTRGAVFLSLLATACTHKEPMSPPAGPSNTCDTSNVSYAKQVQPILQSNCYSCHSSAAVSSGGLDLQNFSSLKSYLNFYYDSDNVYGSKFMHIVGQSGLVLYMPPTYKLSGCEISTIRSWIRNGAIQN